jgi:two-component system sensor histidine kinase SenX3
VPAGVATVLSVLRSSAVVVDDDDVVLKASAPAYAFGLVRGTSWRPDELAELVRQVRRDGQIRETELLMRPPGNPAPRTSPPGSRRSAPGWCSRWSRTAPASAGSRRSAATSSPTSATS